MKNHLLTCLVALLALSGCSTLSLEERKKIFTDENAIFIGKTHDDLIKGKGVPTGTSTLSDGSKVVEYYNAQVEISGGGSYPIATPTYVRNPNGTTTWIYIEQMHTMPVRSWQKICKIDFMISPQNIVSSWKYDGRGCY